MAFEEKQVNQSLKTSDLKMLRKYGEIYSAIGTLELVLRRKIPTVLLVNSQKSENWYEGLPLTEKGQKTLTGALERARRGRLNGQAGMPENFLPFSFWRYLLRSSTYTELWIPSLNLAFPALEERRTFLSFRRLEREMEATLRARNQMAHYELTANLDASEVTNKTLKILEWLGP